MQNFTFYLLVSFWYYIGDIIYTSPAKVWFGIFSVKGYKEYLIQLKFVQVYKMHKNVFNA